MTTINAIRVLNKSVESGEEMLAISTEWSNEKVKIMILRDSNTPLVGEAQLDDFDKYAKSFDKPLQQYVDESKDIFCNKNIDIDFYLKSDNFFWKRKKWALGQISVKPVTDIGVMTVCTMSLLEKYTNIKYKSSELERQNEDLRLVNSQLISQLSKLVSLKNNLETKIYQKVALIINSKKEKIRKLKSKNDTNLLKDLYNVTTDESENELEPQTESKNYSLHQSTKRSLESDESLIEEKKQKNELCAQKFDFSESKPEKQESFIKDARSVLQEDQETPDFISDESVCEMELKLDDEGPVIEEQSSEEMF